MLKSVAVLVGLTLLAPRAGADELDATKSGEVQGEIDLKQDKIKQEYEGRTLNSDERKERAQRLKQSADEVLERNGTTDKEFSRSTAKLGRDQSKMEESRKAVKEKAKADADAKSAETKDAAPAKGTVEKVDGIVIEKGTDAAKAAGAEGADGADGDAPAPPPRRRR
jgi:hypothetical protein